MPPSPPPSKYFLLGAWLAKLAYAPEKFLIDLVMKYEKWTLENCHGKGLLFASATYCNWISRKDEAAIYPTTFAITIYCQSFNSLSFLQPTFYPLQCGIIDGWIISKNFLHTNPVFSNLKTRHFFFTLLYNNLLSIS